MMQNNTRKNSTSNLYPFSMTEATYGVTWPAGMKETAK